MGRGSKSHRPAALAVIAALLAAAILPAAGLAHTPDAEDLIRGDASFVSHHPIAQFESVRPSVADDHCIACHLLRAVSAASPGLRNRVADVTVRAVRRQAATVPLLSRQHRGVPSRAPPALL